MRNAMATLALLTAACAAFGGVGDPQIMTDHPWYPGELSCSTFPRLFATQQALYERVVGEKVESDHDKAMASWYWRNLNVFHCTAGNMDYFDTGITPEGKGGDFTREYWKGLFADGYSLCYATHAQWVGEMSELLGPGRSRAMTVPGHTTFEVYLTGGPYGQGRWALLDHDISTVIFTEDGSRLMSLKEVVDNPSTHDPNNLSTERQHGWRAGGLHPSDPKSYKGIKAAMYAYGYAGPPPRVYLRAGETLRRYLHPGLDDGKTFVYWGVNYLADGIPGPERSRTWVNQPENMYQAKRDAGYRKGQARFANAVYTYQPDFTSGTYAEGVIDESDEHVTFGFQTPYIIGCTPPADADPKAKWSIYQPGSTNGLVISGDMDCPVWVSTDQGTTWKQAAGKDGLDLTDHVKGHKQYWLKFGAGAKTLADSNLTIRTVCQCSPTVIPRVHAGQNKVTYETTGLATCSAGPNRDQALAHRVDGALPSPSVTLELSPPHAAEAVGLYVAAHIDSGSPPKDCSYNVEYSVDGGKEWKPVVENWTVIRHEPEPGDFWSQSFMDGHTELDGLAGPIRVRFTNTGGRAFLRAEAHLVYRVKTTSPLTVTFAWMEEDTEKTATKVYPADTPTDQAVSDWTFQAGSDPRTLWVEYAAE